MSFRLLICCLVVVSCGDTEAVSPANPDGGGQELDVSRGDINLWSDLVPPELDMSGDIQQDVEEMTETDVVLADLNVQDESATEDLTMELDQGSEEDGDSGDLFEAPDDMLIPEEDATGDVSLPVDELTEYNGDFWVDLSATSPFPLTDSCVGDATIVVDPDSSPVIQGEGVCSFAGTMAIFFSGSYEGEMDGEYVTSSDLEGTVSFSLDGFDIEEPWWGTDHGDRLAGEFEGSIVYDDETLGTISASYSGGFEVYP